MPASRCKGITTKGEQCKQKTSNLSGYCSIHRDTTVSQYPSQLPLQPAIQSSSNPQSQSQWIITDDYNIEIIGGGIPGINQTAVQKFNQQLENSLQIDTQLHSPPQYPVSTFSTSTSTSVPITSHNPTSTPIPITLTKANFTPISSTSTSTPISPTPTRSTHVTQCLGTTTKKIRCANKTYNSNGYCDTHTDQHTQKLLLNEQFVHLEQFRQKNIEKPTDCVICMDSLTSDDHTALECGHWFHIECIKDFREAKCPVCRCELVHLPDVVKNNIQKYKSSRPRLSRLQQPIQLQQPRRPSFGVSLVTGLIATFSAISSLGPYSQISTPEFLSSNAQEIRSRARRMIDEFIAAGVDMSDVDISANLAI